MPRSLARLRYRPLLAQGPLSRKRELPDRVATHVDRKSRPGSHRLQVVVNPRAVRQPTGQSRPLIQKPFTLKNVVDPQRTAVHGDIIYVFRNIKTNQIIYSLQELLADHHREQLPFMGRHSKPPVLRPDEWTPHCVITFPTSEQGQNAFRKLREFRKLHELSWDKTNPEWKKLTTKDRMKKIMDQKANMSADLAAVLQIQETHGEDMTKAIDVQEKEAEEYMTKRWQEITALANAAAAKEKEADNMKWLEHQIRSLNLKLAMKHNQNPADQKRLTSAKIIQEIRLRKLQYAIRKDEQFKKAQADLATAAALANLPGAEAKLSTLKQQRESLIEKIATHAKDHNPKKYLAYKADLRTVKTEISSLETAFAAKHTSTTNTHYIARSVLPPKLKKALRAPYTLEGVRVQWVDLQDALAAKGQWPERIEHESLAIHRRRSEIAMLSVEEYEAEKRVERSRILEALRGLPIKGRRAARNEFLEA
ncbi:transcriptional regulation of mitochondrial recombination-domain-containing protein [Phaeosphaeriaceae sp. PMI808]|nr:transcriptional regulation of mitochondrial recombination-domain-containing protein [Phaeosphaeriaceae sp. PMI808]